VISHLTYRILHLGGNLSWFAKRILAGTDCVGNEALFWRFSHSCVTGRIVSGGLSSVWIQRSAHRILFGTQQSRLRNVLPHEVSDKLDIRNQTFGIDVVVGTRFSGLGEDLFCFLLLGAQSYLILEIWTTSRRSCMMMMLLHSMWQNVRILFFSTKVNEITIVGVEMNHFIFVLKIGILRMTLGQHLLFTLLLISSFTCIAITLSKEIIHIVKVALRLRILYWLCMLS